MDLLQNEKLNLKITKKITFEKTHHLMQSH
jgi:hypothetical protein